MWTILEGTRFIDLPISAEREAAVRFMIVGLVLILLMAFRPQGMFGKRRRWSLVTEPAEDVRGPILATAADPGVTTSSSGSGASGPWTARPSTWRRARSPR